MGTPRATMQGQLGTGVEGKQCSAGGYGQERPPQHWKADGIPAVSGDLGTDLEDSHSIEGE